MVGQTYFVSSSITETVEYDGIESSSKEERKDKHDSYFSYSQCHQYILVLMVDSTPQKLYEGERENCIICGGRCDVKL